MIDIGKSGYESTGQRHEVVLPNICIEGVSPFVHQLFPCWSAKEMWKCGDTL